MWSHRDWPVQQMILRLWNNFWCSCCICYFLPMPTAFPKLLQMILFLKAALHHALPSTLAKVIADLGSGFVLFSKFITVSLIILWKVMKAQPDSPILILHSSGYCWIIEMAGTFTIRAIFKQTFEHFNDVSTKLVPTDISPVCLFGPNHMPSLRFTVVGWSGPISMSVATKQQQLSIC